MLFSFCNCTNNSIKNTPLSKTEIHKPLSEFNKYIFTLKKIDSKRLLDTLREISDTVLKNTALDSVSRKGDLYIDLINDTKFLIYKSSEGVISAIIYCKGAKIVTATEYYPNGQVICKFSTNKDGIRDGPYCCYKEDGEIRSSGFYLNGTENRDSARYFDDTKEIIKN